MAKKQTETATPTVESIEINLSDILVDNEMNARQFVSEADDKELAANIKKDGLLQPVGVVAAKQKGKYDLVFGFRRIRAAEILKWKSIPARVLQGDEQTLYFINLGENIARQDLTTYEIALQCDRVATMYDLSSAKIASRLGKSRGYIGNLMRCAANLDKEILERWKQESSPDWGKKGKLCTTDLLNTLQALDCDEQLKRFHALGSPMPDNGGGEGEGDGEGSGTGTPTPPTTRRPSKKHLTAAIAAIKDAEGKSKDWKRGAVLALQWALGNTLTLSDVYDPENPPEKAE